jgi:hypothetical protein
VRGTARLRVSEFREVQGGLLVGGEWANRERLRSELTAGGELFRERHVIANGGVEDELVTLRWRLPERARADKLFSFSGWRSALRTPWTRAE